jgi:hypothetical protein
MLNIRRAFAIDAIKKTAKNSGLSHQVARRRIELLFPG